MRLLYFSRSYTTHDRRFLVELAKSHHQVWYLRLEDDAVCYETRPVPPGIEVLPPLAQGEKAGSPEVWFRLAPRLAAVLDRIHPDVVHAGPIQSCAFLTALVGFRPLLAMSWGSDILVDAYRDEFWTWLTRYALDHAAMLVTDCGEVSDEACKLSRLDRYNIVQFPWGINIAAFRPLMPHERGSLNVRRRAGWADSRIVISTRSWEPLYGVLHLVEAFRLAHDRKPGLRLILIGSGSQGDEIRQRIREARLDDAVWMPGVVPQDRLPDYFRAADVYASFAASDGSSVSLLEAMATGLPAIATDRPSNREWISDAGNGLLVRFGDVNGMADALIEMATLPSGRRADIAARNRAVIEAKADWSLNIDRLFDAYQRLAPAPTPVVADQRMLLENGRSTSCPL